MSLIANGLKGLLRLAGQGLSAWGRFFVRRGWLGRLVWIAVSLVILACACMSGLVGFVATGQAVGLIPRITPTATIGVTVRPQEVVPVTDAPAEATSVTELAAVEPTATQQSRPTQPQASATAAAPSATPRLANTPLPTVAPTTPAPPTVVPVTDTPTAPVIVDTATAPPPPSTETAPAAVGARVVIVAVNKREEYVDIQNQGDQAQDLGGWVLVSERGNQTCGLAGVLEPGVTLRIWAMTGQGGYSCNKGSEIWNNSESDPAVLYNNVGQEVSRH